jgi:outer membrane protein assembly factor BamE (lipoprotein component of BamABCDE complex)
MKIVTALVLTLLLVACGGREFIRPESETLTLGSTRYDQIVKSYGEPLRTGTINRNNVSLKSITYSYAVSVPLTTKLSTKAMSFMFQDDTLVSYDYVSSFADDKNAASYDEEKIKQIARGDNKSKVIGLLGKPSGEAIFPVVPTQGQSLLRYSFIETYRVPFLPTPRITRKNLSITFDQGDTVTDIASSETKPS